MKYFIIGVIATILFLSWIALPVFGIISVKTAILIPVGIIIGILLAMWLLCMWGDS